MSGQKRIDFGKMPKPASVWRFYRQTEAPAPDTPERGLVDQTESAGRAEKATQPF